MKQLKILSKILAKIIIILMVVGFVGLPENASAADNKLDPSLEPREESTNAVSNIYRDMVVVQRRAKSKANKILLSTFGAFDFSDGPTTMYGLNINPGYALSDTLEVYANFVPYFYTSERQIVNKVRSLDLAGGKKATITYATPKMQFGGELIWAPMYGKDSWGAHGIIRSDTFTKLGLAMIQYESDSGFRASWTIGKTWFILPNLNIRAAAGGAYIQAIVDSAKTGYIAGLLEMGSVWYF